MTESFDWITLVMVCALGAMSPGPSLFVILNVAGEKGLNAGIVAAWSHAMGVGLWAIFSVAIWQAVLTQALWLVDFISVIAALYLIFLACRLMTGIFTPNAKIDTVSTSNTDDLPHFNTSYGEEMRNDTSWRRQSALSGFSIAIANPKLMIFFSTLYPQVIPNRLGWIEVLIAVTIPLLIDGSWYHFIVSTTSKMGLLRVLKEKMWITHLCTALLFFYIALQSILGVTL